MVKYYYRLKEGAGSKVGIRAQKVDGFRITSSWTEFSHKLDISKLRQYIEERIEGKIVEKKNKKNLIEILLKRGFTESELKSYKLIQLKNLLELDKEISNGN